MDARRTAIEDEGETLDVGQAASRLGVSPDAIRKRIRRGTLRGYKVDGEWRVVLPNVSPFSLVTPAVPSRTEHDTGLDTALDAALVYLERERDHLLRENERLLSLTERQAKTFAELVGQLGTTVTTPRPATESSTAPRRRSWRPSWLWLWRWTQKEPSR